GHAREARLDRDHGIRRSEQPLDVRLREVRRHVSDFLMKLIAPFVSITAHAISPNEPMFCCRIAAARSSSVTRSRFRFLMIGSPLRMTQIGSPSRYGRRRGKRKFVYETPSWSIAIVPMASIAPVNE